MEETIQMNIRIPKALIYDMELIAQNLKISRNDWFKYTLAKIIAKEKTEIIQETERKYVHGLLSDKQFKEITGIQPTQEIITRKEEINEEIQKYRNAGKNYIRMLAKEIDAKK